MTNFEEKLCQINAMYILISAIFFTGFVQMNGNKTTERAGFHLREKV